MRCAQTCARNIDRGLLQTAKQPRSAIQNRSDWPRQNPRPVVRNPKYVVLLALFLVVVFWKAALTRQYTILAWSDSAGQTYPWSQYIAATLHRHSFPFWDPFIDGGRPFVGEAQTAVFYPLNLAMAALPLNRRGLLPVSYITAFVLLHCFLSSLFTYLLARRFGLSRFAALIAAVAYTYSGSVARRSFAQINLFYGTTWIPAVFLCYFKALAEKRVLRRLIFVNLGGLCLALTFLAGHHQPPLYCGIALGFTAAILWFRDKQDEDGGGIVSPRRALVVVTALVFVFAGLYSAPQLIPSYQYASRAYRWVDVGENQQPVMGNQTVPYTTAGKFILHPRNLVLLLFANQTPVDNPPYFGILPLFFLLLSVRQLRRSRIVRWCWGLLLLFVGLSLGSYSPLHGLFYVFVPFFQAARASQRALMMAHFAAAFLAGFGADDLLNHIGANFHDQQLWLLRALQWLGGAALVLTFLVSGMYVYKTELLGANADYDGLFFACLLLLASAALLLLRTHGLVEHRTLIIGMVIILLFDYHGFLAPYIQPRSGFDRATNFEPTHYYAEDELLRFLRERSGSARISFRDAYYPKPIGDVYRFETTSGTEATRLKEEADLGTGSRIDDLMGVRYIVAGEPLPLPKAFGEGKITVYENPASLPRAWLVSKLVTGVKLESIPARLHDPNFDMRHQALLTQSQDELKPAPALLKDAGGQVQPGKADFMWRSVNHFTVATTSERAGFLVVSEAYYPGWTATVNGSTRPVFRCDGALMGVFAGPGSERIEFVFRPSYLRTAVALSLVAILVLISSVLALIGRGTAVASKVPAI